MIDYYKVFYFLMMGFWFYHCNGKITIYVSKKDGKLGKEKIWEVYKMNGFELLCAVCLCKTIVEEIVHVDEGQFLWFFYFINCLLLLLISSAISSAFIC